MRFLFNLLGIALPLIGYLVWTLATAGIEALGLDPKAQASAQSASVSTASTGAAETRLKEVLGIRSDPAAGKPRPITTVADLASLASQPASQR